MLSSSNKRASSNDVRLLRLVPRRSLFMRVISTLVSGLRTKLSSSYLNSMCNIVHKCKKDGCRQQDDTRTLFCVGLRESPFQLCWHNHSINIKTNSIIHVKPKKIRIFKNVNSLGSLQVHPSTRSRAPWLWSCWWGVGPVVRSPSSSYPRAFRRCLINRVQQINSIV